MIVTVPARLQCFFQRCAPDLTPAGCAMLAWIVAAYLLVTGKRSQSAIGREVLDRQRHVSSVSRRLRRPCFRTRDLTRAEMLREVAEELKRAGGRKETWFLIIDGVCLRRGRLTKIQNAVVYKKNRKKRGRGAVTKAHTFVLGLLVTPTGRRIPLPRRSFYTHGYVRTRNKELAAGERQGLRLAYKSQIDLACLIVEELDLPTHLRLVVLADEYFDSRKLTDTCRTKGATLITPVNSLRSFDGGGRVHQRGKALSRRTYRDLVLCRGGEETASYRRREPSGTGRKKDERVYRLFVEPRTLATTGRVAVVYSWKKRRDRSGRQTGKETFKVLVCSDPTLAGETIVEYYEMRWEIEVFFREWVKAHSGSAPQQAHAHPPPVAPRVRQAKE